ncbi:MAG: 3-hydroxyacyl-CoA dehydrogenase [Thermoleophilaceae bacterium]|nr:3-hydroxyacyl-CoA dehydrogenase [Thermoleophilaceae bacterium]
MADAPQRLGVVGAGTMGAGIAQLGVLAGMDTLLHDPVPDALSRGGESIAKNLAKGAERGRWSTDDADAAKERLTLCPELAGLASCELVIEAAPERTELKRELFAALSGVLEDPAAVIASNTSSIPITALAGGAERPENVVGMHFFNPAPLMKLVEIIPAAQSSERAVAVTTATGEAMGKRTILAQDGPGFIVNRCGRPFYTEALRLLQERVATHEQIDRICRMAGGFRMGPFELMDMVGIDVGFEVAKSFTELSFGEPRWRPNPIQARMVSAGWFGRKSGRGYYSYENGQHRTADPEPQDAPSGPANVAELREAVDGIEFYAVDPLGSLVEVPGERDPAVEARFADLGFHVEWVGRAPAGVLGRIVAGLVNEACFAIGEGVGSAADIDAGLELGLNHPRGPLAWGELIGFDAVFAMLNEIWQERREERYRPAPELVRWARGDG